jgi:hypothetical protein
MMHYKPPVPVQGTEAGTQPGAVLRDHPVRFENVEGSGVMTRIQIIYRNPDQVARYAKLRVNGQVATVIAFPPSGKKMVRELCGFRRNLTGGVRKICSIFLPTATPDPSSILFRFSKGPKLV